MRAAEDSKEQAALELQAMRAKLAQMNRDSEEIQKALRNTESCANGWQSKCRSVQVERDQLAKKLTALASTNEGTPTTQYIEDQQEASDKVRQLEEQIKTLQDDLAIANNTLSNQDQDHELALSARDQMNDAKMAELKDVYYKERVRSRSILVELANSQLQAEFQEAQEASVRDRNDKDQAVQILTTRIEAIQQELDKRDEDHRKFTLDTEEKYALQLVTLQASSDQEKVIWKVLQHFVLLTPVHRKKYKRLIKSLSMKWNL